MFGVQDVDAIRDAVHKNDVSLGIARQIGPAVYHCHCLVEELHRRCSEATKKGGAKSEGRSDAFERQAYQLKPKCS